MRVACWLLGLVALLLAPEQGLCMTTQPKDGQEAMEPEKDIAERVSGRCGRSTSCKHCIKDDDCVWCSGANLCVDNRIQSTEAINFLVDSCTEIVNDVCPVEPSPSSNPIAIPSPSPQEEMPPAVCPGNPPCSNNGRCSEEGKCICKPYYSGETCEHRDHCLEITDCMRCLFEEGCGWCADNRRCSLGKSGNGDAGPEVGRCPNWSFTPRKDSCKGVDRPPVDPQPSPPLLVPVVANYNYTTITNTTTTSVTKTVITTTPDGASCPDASTPKAGAESSQEKGSDSHDSTSGTDKAGSSAVSDTKGSESSEGHAGTTPGSEGGKDHTHHSDENKGQPHDPAHDSEGGDKSSNTQQTDASNPPKRRRERRRRPTPTPVAEPVCEEPSDAIQCDDDTDVDTVSVSVSEYESSAEENVTDQKDGSSSTSETTPTTTEAPTTGTNNTGTNTQTNSTTENSSSAAAPATPDSTVGNVTTSNVTESNNTTAGTPDASQVNATQANATESGAGKNATGLTTTSVTTTTTTVTTVKTVLVNATLDNVPSCQEPPATLDELVTPSPSPSFVPLPKCPPRKCRRVKSSVSPTPLPGSFGQPPLGDSGERMPDRVDFSDVTREALFEPEESSTEGEKSPEPTPTPTPTLAPTPTPEPTPLPPVSESEIAPEEVVDIPYPPPPQGDHAEENQAGNGSGGQAGSDDGERRSENSETSKSSDEKKSEGSDDKTSESSRGNGGRDADHESKNGESKQKDKSDSHEDKKGGSDSSEPTSRLVTPNEILDTTEKKPDPNRPLPSTKSNLITLTVLLRTYSPKEFGFLEIAKLKKAIQISFEKSKINIGVDAVEVSVSPDELTGRSLVSLRIVVLKGQESGCIKSLVASALLVPLKQVGMRINTKNDFEIVEQPRPQEDPVSVSPTTSPLISPSPTKSPPPFYAYTQQAVLKEHAFAQVGSGHKVPVSPDDSFEDIAGEIFIPKAGHPKVVKLEAAANDENGKRDQNSSRPHHPRKTSTAPCDGDAKKGDLPLRHNINPISPGALNLPRSLSDVGEVIVDVADEEAGGILVEQEPGDIGVSRIVDSLPAQAIASRPEPEELRTTMPDGEDAETTGCMELTVGHDHLLSPAQQKAVHDRVLAAERDQAMTDAEARQEIDSKIDSIPVDAVSQIIPSEPYSQEVNCDQDKPLGSGDPPLNQIGVVEEVDLRKAYEKSLMHMPQPDVPPPANVTNPPFFPEVPDCQAFSTCTSCARNPYCTWCGASNTTKAFCLNYEISDIICSDRIQSHLQCFDKCSVHTDCYSCNLGPDCGWCGAQQACVSGDRNGPREGTCDSWQFSRSLSTDDARAACLGSIDLRDFTSTKYYNKSLPLPSPPDYVYPNQDLTNTHLVNMNEQQQVDDGDEDEPEEIVLPEAVINGPGQIGMCNGLSLDAQSSISAGSQIVGYHWALVSLTEGSQKIASILSAAENSTFVSLPNHVLTGLTSLTVSLVVTNELGHKSNATYHTVRIMLADLPTVAIYGPRQVSHSSMIPLKFRCAVERPGCATSVEQLGFKWTSSPEVNLPTNLLTRRDLAIPAGTLTAGVKYEFTISAFVASRPELVSQDSVTVVVAPERLEIDSSEILFKATPVNDGNATAYPYVLPKEGVVQIDASDLLGGMSSEGVRYVWRCEVGCYRREVNDGSSRPCVFQNGSDVIIPEGNPLNMSADNLPSGEYLITETAILPAGFPSDTPTLTKEVCVPITHDKAVNLHVYTSFGKMLKPEQGGSVTVEVVDAAGIEVPNLRFVWYLDEVTHTHTSQKMTPAIDDVASSFTTNKLELKPAVLVAGATYLFSVAITDAQGATVSRPVTVAVASQPKAGHITVSPESGVSLSTKFSISALGFETIPEFQPVSYSFYAAHPVLMKSLPLALDQGNATLETVLPRLVKTSDQYLPLTLLVVATDSNGATAQGAVTVNIEEAPEDAPILSDSQFVNTVAMGSTSRAILAAWLLSESLLRANPVLMPIDEVRAAYEKMASMISGMADNNALDKPVAEQLLTLLPRIFPSNNTLTIQQSFDILNIIEASITIVGPLNEDIAGEVFTVLGNIIEFCLSYSPAPAGPELGSNMARSDLLQTEKMTAEKHRRARAAARRESPTSADRVVREIEMIEEQLAFSPTKILLMQTYTSALEVTVKAGISLPAGSPQKIHFRAQGIESYAKRVPFEAVLSERTVLAAGEGEHFSVVFPEHMFSNPVMQPSFAELQEQNVMSVLYVALLSEFDPYDSEPSSPRQSQVIHSSIRYGTSSFELQFGHLTFPMEFTVKIEGKTEGILPPLQCQQYMPDGRLWDAESVVTLSNDPFSATCIVSSFDDVALFRRANPVAHSLIQTRHSRLQNNQLQPELLQQPQQQQQPRSPKFPQNSQIDSLQALIQEDAGVDASKQDSPQTALVSWTGGLMVLGIGTMFVLLLATLHRNTRPTMASA